jgi:hypothetical protein
MLTAQSAAAQAPLSPTEAANQFIAARNAGNADAAVALFAPGGTFRGAGACAAAPCSGASLLAQMKTETSLHIKVTVLGTEASGDTAAVRVNVVTDRIRQCGVDRAVATETYTVSGGKITSVVAALDATDAQTAKLLACLATASAPTPAPAPPSAGTGLRPSEGSASPYTAVGLTLATLGGAATVVAVRHRARR